MSTLDHMLGPEAVRRIEVITGTGRRRRFSDDDKARIVEETLVPGAVISAIARRPDAATAIQLAPASAAAGDGDSRSAAAVRAGSCRDGSWEAEAQGQTCSTELSYGAPSFPERAPAIPASSSFGRHKIN